MKPIYFLALVVIVLLLDACGDHRSNRTYTDSIYSTKGGKPKLSKKDTVAKAKNIFLPFDNVTHEDSFATKSSYKIALLLPFNIDSFYKDSTAIGYSAIPKGIYPALDFYEGTLIALDSLKKAGVHFDVQVVDYSSQRMAFNQIAGKYHLKDMDLLIGTLSSLDAKPVAEFAAENRITFVSPLANSYAPTHNPFYVSLNPSLYAQQQKLVGSILTCCGKNARVLCLHPNSANENAMATSISTQLAKVEKNEFKINTINCQVKTPVDSIKRLLSKTRPNVLIISSNESSYVYPIIRKLNELADSFSISVFGLPSWNSFENLKTIASKRLKIYYTNTYFVDRAAPAFLHFSRQFVEHYKIKPSELAIRGYSTMLACGLALDKHGVRFHYFMPKSTKTLYGAIKLKPLYRLEEMNGRHYTQHFQNAIISLVKIESNSVIRISGE